MHTIQTCFFTCSWKSWVARGEAVPAPVRLGGTFTVVTESGTDSVPLEVLHTTLQIIKLPFFSPLWESQIPAYKADRVSVLLETRSLAWGTQQTAPHSPQNTERGIIFPKDGSCPPSPMALQCIPIKNSPTENGCHLEISQPWAVGKLCILRDS